MSKEITDKTWGMQTRSFGVIWLTEPEATLARQAFRDGAKYLEFGGLTVALGDIAGFATGERLREVERRKRGDWECPRHPGNWIPRGNTCGRCGA